MATHALRAAIGDATALRGVAAGLPRQAHAAGLAWHPVVGLGLGGLAAAGAAVAGQLVPGFAGIVGVLVLEAFGSRRTGPRTLHVGALAARLWAATVLPPPARMAAFLLAPMLARWAVVVQCYGGVPARAPGPAPELVGQARFQEFAWASLVAFSVTLGLAEAVGLLVLLVAAVATLAVRVEAHRRLGGMSGGRLGASGELVETAVFVVLALLGRAAGEH